MANPTIPRNSHEAALISSAPGPMRLNASVLGERYHAEGERQIMGYLDDCRVKRMAFRPASCTIRQLVDDYVITRGN